LSSFGIKNEVARTLLSECATIQTVPKSNNGREVTDRCPKGIIARQEASV
jgi:hypothetical protein